ncbi:TPA: MerR family transcriptional regulator [Clostridioides difficile]
MFKIGEFSKLTQVSTRMLRYYDETGLLKPAKIDSLTGYRMYSAEQISTLNRIIYLRDSGFNVAEIALALNFSNNAIIEQLDRKSIEIMDNIQKEQEKLKKIEIAKKEVLHGKSELYFNITIKEIPSYCVLSLRKEIPNYYYEGELWKELSVFAKENKINISDETFSIYHNEEYKEKDVDVELCAIVNKIGKATGDFKFRFTEPVSMMACTMVYGDFFNISYAYRSFAKWLQENSQYKMKGSSHQIVHRGPWNEKNPENYLTEIQIPLENLL